MLNIPHIQLKFFYPAQGVSALYLRPTGYTWLHIMATCLKSRIIGKYSTRKGRGPIKLISPFSTLINCGISSNEVDRINLPMGVFLCAGGSRFPLASFFSFMVLNLITLKSLPLLPGRIWKKKGLPELAIDKPIITNMKIGDSIINPINVKRKSKKPLKKILYIYR